MALVDKALFCNCLIAMQLQMRTKELVSAYEVSTYLETKFVDWMGQLQKEIQVSKVLMLTNKNVLTEY